MLLEHDEALASLFTTEPTLAATEPGASGQASAELLSAELVSAECMPLDPGAVMLLSILECLNAEHAQGRAQVSLAALCKRLELRMSTLQRLMTALSEQALVHVHIHKERLVASLTAEGAAVALALQSA
ncbi:hypothetical protein [Methylophilus aquaticus]|uniref:MarR family transcriptional regulator n=1 Tax=Methylophilus aquaticus TaxID=1971610 RepID=A0ABT9JYL0_9PROT|nr:hypothetical protein [Methylophilus aquaticus]MDP8568900.1 hypothetical protein [Methylophilus aquaticus]